MDTQPTSSTRWRGRWCWTKKRLLRPWNAYALFRRVLELALRPTEAIVRVSADARYALYVNGERIHQGPARSAAARQSYDELDLADALRPGKNTLCAVVHQFGVPTFQSTYCDASGFLVDGEVEVDGATVPLHTPGGWLCREARGWRRDVARLSHQLGFQEHFDADADPPLWMSPDYTPSPEEGWAEPVDLGPVGAHPWLSMEPRGVPLLVQHRESFETVVAQFTGENARGYKVAEDVAQLLLQEKPRKDKAHLDEAGAMLLDDDALTIVKPPAEGGFVMVVLDLGRVRAGHLSLDIAEAAGDEIIDIIYTEELDRSGIPSLAARTEGESPAPADRYRCRPGAQRWEPFWYRGFRYATLVFRNLTAPLKVRHVGMRAVHAGVEPLGPFECSDAMLTRIWRVGQHTLLNCMFDAYVDSPSRGQAQWWNSARVAFRAAAYAFGDVSLLTRGIRLMARSQAPDGSLHGTPPAQGPLDRPPDAMLAWVLSLWEHYFHCGQTDLVAECLPTMHRLLEFFAAHESAEGLIGGFDGFGIFIDSHRPYVADFGAPLNLMYLQALRCAEALCIVAGDSSRADAYAARAAALTATAERCFWDPKARLWRDGWDPVAQRPVEAVSQHANALAMLLHIKPEANAALAKDVLLKSAGSRRSKVLTASPYFYAFVLDALAEANFKAEAVGLIRGKWGDMIDRGATAFWEDWEPAHGSRCHAWSTSPVYHLSRLVLGVTPVDVGWKQVQIAPVPMQLEYARGRVPSPHGLIGVEWEKAGEDQLAVRIELPEGVEGEFVGPLGETRSLEGGVHQFHT